MRRLAQACALAGLLLGAGSASAQRSTSTRVSADGSHGVRLTELAPGQCKVEVIRETTLAWSVDKCLGGLSDLYFVSNDGQRVWVLITLPPKPKPEAGTWMTAVVAKEFDATGKQVAARTLGDLVPPLARGQLRELGKHIKWLEGVAGVAGKTPRVTDGNVVEFETVGPTTVRLTF